MKAFGDTKHKVLARDACMDTLYKILRGCTEIGTQIKKGTNRSYQVDGCSKDTTHCMFSWHAC